MTAEIAILNRTAIALAADSAVTISVSGKTKVYDTAEKLFELSKRQPIAIMIYNNVEYVGVPLDVIIRKFRQEKDAAKVVYERMEDVCSQFVSYLCDFPHDISEQKRHLYSILRDEFRYIADNVRDRVLRSIDDWLKDPASSRVKPSEVLMELIKATTKTEAARPLDGFLASVTLTQFRAKFSDVVRRAAAEVFTASDLDAATKRELDKLAFALVKSDRGSDLRTGLVFGGFAKADMFPTLRYMEIDGIYFDELKILSTNEIDIDRKRTRAAVVPFAQKEMVERFMFGLDSELEGEIRSFVRSVAHDVVEVAATSLDQAAAAAIRRKVNDQFKSLVDKLKESSRQDLLDIVYFMSKKELADIAHALVELTSQKRRFSTDDETVGGPIDVAIITKNEGLIWIQRKHYFNSDINGGFVARTRSN